MKLLIASRNKHKIKEISQILDFPDLQFVSSLDFPDIPEVVEDGHTLEENAIKKAVTLATETGLWAMADDSGLEVDALNGQPGVFSARFAGDHVCTSDNNKKLLDLLGTQENRSAQFRCVLALAHRNHETKLVEGVCRGVIGYELKGATGFGYDPLFIPDGYKLTFAELGQEIKNRISHRAQALFSARAAWREVFK